MSVTALKGQLKGFFFKMIIKNVLILFDYINQLLFFSLFVLCFCVFPPPPSSKK